MGKYLITGRPGAGKTTVIKEFERRGYTAYNTDAIEGVTELEDSQSGEIVTWPEGPVDWTKFRWNWQADRLKELLASDDDVFIGAVTGNQEQFYSLFNKVFALTVDSQTIAKRLEVHEHNRHPEEKARIVANHVAKQQNFINNGATPIDNTRPVDQVVDEILSKIHDK